MWYHGDRERLVKETLACDLSVLCPEHPTIQRGCSIVWFRSSCQYFIYRALNKVDIKANYDPVDVHEIHLI